MPLRARFELRDAFRSLRSSPRFTMLCAAVLGLGDRTGPNDLAALYGAPPSGGLPRLIVGRAAMLAGVGAIVGIASALIATRSLRSLLYGISATDPLTFIAVPALFLVVAILASYAPALRATRVDPVKALRSD